MLYTNTSCIAADTLKNLKQIAFSSRLKLLKAMPQYHDTESTIISDKKHTKEHWRKKPKAEELYSRHHTITSSLDILSTPLLARL